MKLYVDISNYVQTRAHTGIQRVVREFILRLLKQNDGIDYSILYFDIAMQHFIQIDDTEVIHFLSDIKSYKFLNLMNTIKIEELQEEDIFFDMDGCWNNGLKRTYLYKKLKVNNVKICNFIYDLVPIVKPQFSHQNTVINFTSFLYAVYTYSDLVFFDSRSAEKDFLDVKEKIGSIKEISTKVTKLGSDIHFEKNPTKGSQYIRILDSKYILFVGTLEPRKNQKLMLDVFEKLEKKHHDLHMVFVGKEGWDNTILIERLRKHPLRKKNLHWLNQVNDEELTDLYKNAYLFTYLSEYEGFGLPIAESLRYGKPTITSKNSSMYEVGKNFADYITYNSFNELYELLDLYLTEDALYTHKKEFISQNYLPYTWDMTYKSVMDVFKNINKKIVIDTPKTLQFVFISIDIKNLMDTIQEMDKYIDFIKEYIIITRSDMVENFKNLVSTNKITIIDENNILGKYAKDFASRDHVSKNWLLRASLLKLDILDDQFIMLDDDNRPLQNIEIEHFIENKKYNAYYFYDLLEWNSFQTDYDIGQHNMKSILDKDGLELLSYSSHKPQIIDKKIFKEVVDKYFDIGLSKPIDEWSTYFNYAVSNYPFLFNKKKYDTLNWPGNPSDWRQKYFQDTYVFENYYETNKTGTYEEKVEHKNSKLQPYLETSKLNIENIKDYKEYNMVHGTLSFIQNEKSIYISNIPYFIKAKMDAWIKLSVNYKAINLTNTKVILMYTINGVNGASTPLFIENSYEDNVIDFGISCESLQPGEYTLLLDAYIDNKKVYGNNSPYMLKLFIR